MAGDLQTTNYHVVVIKNSRNEPFTGCNEYPGKMSVIFDSPDGISNKEHGTDEGEHTS
jgi:hypothetical protein